MNDGPISRSNDLKEKSPIIGDIYDRNFAFLLSIAARFKSHKEDQLDAIHDFFCDKIIPRDIKLLKQIQTMDMNKISWWFRNYMIDIYRKETKQKKEIEAYIDRIQAVREDTVSIKDIEINDRTKIIINKYSKIIEEHFTKSIYIDIFKMMIDGLNDSIIAERIGIKTKTVSTAKHRIRKLLKEQQQGILA